MKLFEFEFVIRDVMMEYLVIIGNDLVNDWTDALEGGYSIDDVIYVASYI